MPNFDFVIFATVTLCIVLMLFLGVRKAAKEPFLASLIEKYRANENATHGVNLKMRYIGWVQEGNAIARRSAVNRIGIDNDSLYIAQLPVISRAIPTIEIPLHCLSLISSKYIWTAFLRVDVFQIAGISSWQLLLPVGLVPEDKRKEDERSQVA